MSVLSIMNALGQMGGFILPFVYVQTNNSNYGVIKNQIYSYLMMHTIVAAVNFTLTVFFFRENNNYGGKNTNQNGQDENN